jgi:hypothetical protein
MGQVRGNIILIQVVWKAYCFEYDGTVLIKSVKDLNVNNEQV